MCEWMNRDCNAVAIVLAVMLRLGSLNQSKSALSTTWPAAHIEPSVNLNVADNKFSLYKFGEKCIIATI